MHRRAGWTALALPLAACDGPQSMLAGQGVEADWVATLSWVMFVGGGLVFALVMGLLAVAILGHRRGWLAGRGAVIIGGIAFPVVVLVALLTYGLGLTRAVARLGDGPPLAIEVVGEQWWWRVRYLDGDGRVRFETANEVVLPTGRVAELRLSSADVIHSLWLPELAGKRDMIPGRQNVLHVQAGREGVFRGQCAEYCGGAHALMSLDLMALSPDAFAAWAARQERAAGDPALPFLARGRDLFLAVGCGACHAVRGTPAAGDLGPDLTHVGGRRTLAAGTLPNNVGTIAGWIADSQHLKPGNRMPSFDMLSGEDLRAVAAWLGSLK